MTDPKSLIAEARRRAQLMPEDEFLLEAISDALEEATPPDGWRVTEFERGDGARAVRRRDGSWHALDRSDFRVPRDGQYIHSTAREAMAALDAQKAPPPG